MPFSTKGRTLYLWHSLRTPKINLEDSSVIFTNSEVIETHLLRPVHSRLILCALYWTHPTHTSKEEKRPVLITWLVLSGRKAKAAAILPWAASRLAYWLIFSAKSTPTVLASMAWVSCTAFRRMTTFSIRSWMRKRRGSEGEVDNDTEMYTERKQEKIRGYEELQSLPKYSVHYHQYLKGLGEWTII